MSQDKTGSQANVAQEPPFRYGPIMALGLGMFGVSLAAGIYNSYVPLFIRHYVHSAGVIGLIVSLRTLAGIVLNIYFSSRSDRTQNRWGRRLPYIYLGMPITGLLFIMFPWKLGAAFLITIDLVYALASNIFYAPTVALMPDVTPPLRRSQANGIINAMSGFAALLAFFIGPALFHLGRNLPFDVVGVLFLLIPLAMRWKVKEPAQVPSDGAVGLQHLWNSAKELVKRTKRRPPSYFCGGLLLVRWGELG